MKTINEAAIEFEKESGEKIYYANIENGPCTNLSVESFKAGVEFAKRWIPVEEELPEKCMKIYSGLTEKYKNTDKVIYKTSNSKYGITTRSKFLDNDWQWSGSGTLQGSITHWRPIELK